jgi:hypothetical protein
MYLYLNSTASSQLYRENRPDSFIQKLPRRLTRADIVRTPLHEAWEVALVDLRTPRFTAGNSCESLAVFCNICTVSVHENDMSPILTLLHRPFNHINTEKPLILRLDKPRYVRLTDHTIEHIKLYLVDQEGRSAPFESGSLRCTLHLRPCCE